MMYPDYPFLELYVRALLFLCGAAMAVHNFCTLNFIKTTPHHVRWFLVAAASIGVGLAYSAWFSSIPVVITLNLLAVSILICLQYSIWIAGVHISEALNHIYSDGHELQKRPLKNTLKKNFIEAFVGSIGIMLVGLITIPFAGRFANIEISLKQAASMGVVFFTGRLLWLWFLRSVFDIIYSKLVRKNNAA